MSHYAEAEALGVWCRGQLTSIESTQQEVAKLETGILDDLEALREESDSTRDTLRDIAATLLALYKAVNSLRSAAPKDSLNCPDSPQIAQISRSKHPHSRPSSEKSAWR